MKKFILLLFLPIAFLGCKTIRSLNSAEASLYFPKEPKLEIGDISITDYKNLPGDTEQARAFLKNIILSRKHKLSENSDYVLNITIKERAYSQDLDQIYSVTSTLEVFSKSTKGVVYRGILIKESKKPFVSPYRLFQLIKESYSRFKSYCRVSETRAVKNK